VLDSYRSSALELTHPEDVYYELLRALPLGNLASPGPWNYQPPDKPKSPHVALSGDTPPVWTLDLDQNRIFYDRDGQHLFYEFSIPERTPIRLKDFQTYVPMPLPSLTSKQVSLASSLAAAPRDVIPEALFDLVYRLASDYEYNWQSAGLTNERYGLHCLAMGILSCFTLNVSVQEISPRNMRRHPYFTRPDPSNMLQWRQWPSPQVIPTVSLGKTQIIFTERMDLAVSLVHDHFNNMIVRQLDILASDFDFREAIRTAIRTGAWWLTNKIHYIVTSIREIQYFTKTFEANQPRMTMTPVIPFFSGIGAPSKTGVRWLLNAIHAETHPLRTRIHRLPVELQEIILRYARPPELYNMLDRAVFAARLNLGIPFNFSSPNHPIVLRELSHERGLDEQASEFQVLIWGTYVGMTYQVDKGRQTGKLSDLSDWTWDYGRRFVQPKFYQGPETMRQKFF
jgi:hypothetical protein